MPFARKKKIHNIMLNLFIGDSITSGDNNNGKSYADYIPLSEKIGISGTTMGEYSIYPVDGNSLLSIIPKNIEKIKRANNIILEYGINDISSFIVKNVSKEQIIIAFTKCLDYIRQINPKVKIYFLSGINAIDSLARKQCNYLKREYFKFYRNIKDKDYKKWKKSYKKLIKIISKYDVEIIEIFKDNNEYLNYLDIDDLHPNNIGYKIIADNIIQRS